MTLNECLRNWKIATQNLESPGPSGLCAHSTVRASGTTTPTRPDSRSRQAR